MDVKEEIARAIGDIVLDSSCGGVDVGNTFSNAGSGAAATGGCGTEPDEESFTYTCSAGDAVDPISFDPSTLHTLLPFEHVEKKLEGVRVEDAKKGVGQAPGKRRRKQQFQRDKKPRTRRCFGEHITLMVGNVALVEDEVLPAVEVACGSGSSPSGDRLHLHKHAHPALASCIGAAAAPTAPRFEDRNFLDTIEALLRVVNQNQGQRNRLEEDGSDTPPPSPLKKTLSASSSVAPEDFSRTVVDRADVFSTSITEHDHGNKENPSTNASSATSSCLVVRIGFLVRLYQAFQTRDELEDALHPYWTVNEDAYPVGQRMPTWGTARDPEIRGQNNALFLETLLKNRTSLAPRAGPSLPMPDAKRSASEDEPFWSRGVNILLQLERSRQDGWGEAGSTL